MDSVGDIIPVNLALGGSTSIGKLRTGMKMHYRNRAAAGISLIGQNFCQLYRVIPYAIKIDVDGVELEVLSGGAKVLPDLAVHRVLIEVNHNAEASIVDSRKNLALS